MQIFFHGWRRKVGCVLLVVAVAVLGMWMRSRFCRDDFVLAFSKKTAIVAVIGGRGVQWSWRWQDGEGYFHPSDGGPAFYEVMFDDSKTVDWKTYPFVDLNADPFQDLQWSYRWGSLGCGGTELGPIGSLELNVPYWPMIFLISLVAAVLLLVPSRTEFTNKRQSHA